MLFKKKKKKKRWFSDEVLAWDIRPGSVGSDEKNKLISSDMLLHRRYWLDQFNHLTLRI